MTAAGADPALARLRALMAMTVANGCTADEELAAARMVARMIEQVDGPADPPPSPPPPSSWAGRERASPEFQTLLEKNTLEGLLRAAIQEMALGHINTVAPRRPARGQPAERVLTADLLRPYFQMALGAAVGSRLARSILDDMLEELIQDGLLPDILTIPRGD